MMLQYDVAVLDIADLNALRRYLESTHRISASDTIDLIPLTGGVSARTILVRNNGIDTWVIKQALPKLAVKSDWFSDPARIHREAEALRWLPRIAPPEAFTPLIFEDFDNHLIAMQAVPQPHENLKSMLMSQKVELKLMEQFGALLGAIHCRASESPEPLSRIFGDVSFFESLRIEPYYEFTAAQVPAAADFLRDLIGSTRQIRATLVHGDYSPKNVLVRDSRIILLDHEVIHWGDPGFDIGFALAHLLSKAHHFMNPRFRDAAIEFWHAYRSVIGPWNATGSIEATSVRHTLGCLLARVAGRSPLEYLDARERQRQQNIVVALMARPVASIEQLIDLFLMGIELDANH